METYIIWGTGKRAETNYIFSKKFSTELQVIAFVDNNALKQGKLFHGIPVISPQEIHNLKWDYIDIWTDLYSKEIEEQLVCELGLRRSQIRDFFLTIRESLFARYADTQEKDIREFLEYLRNRKWVSIYNFRATRKYEPTEAYFDDEKKLYYTFFEGKKLYVKKGYPLLEIKGKKYISNFWGEQDENSPHRYEDDVVAVREGDVLVDAGACEGNFTLHNIEKVSKVYVIECDPAWVEALKCTFEPWKEKVEFCCKYLGKKDSDTEICLDTLIGDAKVDFIKMDIEGQELNAIEGAKNTILKYKPKMLISCYHRTEDIYQLPMKVLSIRSDYKVYMRHYPYIPAWDTNFYFI